MKKFILLFALLIGSLNTVLVAQDTITIDPRPSFHATADLQDLTTNPGDVVAHSVIVISNESPGIKTYVWERTVNILPTGWTSAVCDTNQCYLSHVETKEFLLGPGDEGRLDAHVYPGGNPGLLPGTPGEAEMHIRVWEKDNPSESETAIYTFCVSDGPNSPVNCSTSSTADVTAQQVRVFPNPTSNRIQISDNNDLVKYLQVYNLIGERVAHFRNYDGRQHDVSQLSQGMYLLQMLDNQGGLLKTVKLVVE